MITEVKLHNSQHTKILKQIQHLPDRTSVEAVYYLLEQLPIEAILDQRRLNLFGAIYRGQGVERKIAKYQLANKDIKSHRWFVRTGITLAKYILPDTHSLLEDPPSKGAWRSTVKKAVENYWATKFYYQATSKSSMRYINWETDKFFQAHHLWSSVDHKHTDVHRASVKTRLATGTYILRANKSRFNKFAVDPTCTLCREHSVVV